MKSLSIVALLAGCVASHPLTQRSAGYDDATILNYALTLEHLENTFYRQGLANFSRQNFLDAGFADPFYQNLVEIAKDEAIHVQFLTAALQGEHAVLDLQLLVVIADNGTAVGATAVGECAYTFPVADVKVRSCIYIPQTFRWLIVQ